MIESGELGTSWIVVVPQAVVVWALLLDDISLEKLEAQSVLKKHGMQRRTAWQWG